VGLVAGVLIGVNLHAAPEPRPPDHTLLPPRASTSATAPAAAHIKPRPAVDLDLGTDAARVALESGWEAMADGSERTAVVATASKAVMALSARPQGGKSTLMAVARAQGITKDHTIGVAASVGETVIAKWVIDSQWGLYVQPWPDDEPVNGKVALELAINLPQGGRADEAVRPGVAFDHLQLTTLGQEAEIDLRTAAGRALLLAGFWPVEQNALGNLAGVWSNASTSRLALALRPIAADYALRLRAAAFGPIAPLEVRARINDKPVGSQQVTEINDYVYRVPSGILVEGANTIVLEYSKMSSPAEHGEKDKRQMSVQLFELSVEPALP